MGLMIMKMFFGIAIINTFQSRSRNCCCVRQSFGWLVDPSVCRQSQSSLLIIYLNKRRVYESYIYNVESQWWYAIDLCYWKEKRKSVLIQLRFVAPRDLFSFKLLWLAQILYWPRYCTWAGLREFSSICNNTCIPLQTCATLSVYNSPCSPKRDCKCIMWPDVHIL